MNNVQTSTETTRTIQIDLSSLLGAGYSGAKVGAKVGAKDIRAMVGAKPA